MDQNTHLEYEHNHSFWAGPLTSLSPLWEQRQGFQTAFISSGVRLQLEVRTITTEKVATLKPRLRPLLSVNARDK